MASASSRTSHRRSLRKRRALVVTAAAVAAGVGAGVLVMNANAGAVDLYHQVLPAKDGWAASGSGTTGGAKADAAHTFTVSTRAQLVKALGSQTDTTPRIIKIKGTIDANTNDSGKKLTCADYASGTGYSLSAYLKAFDPATYGKKAPSGTQETARKAAADKQKKNIVFRVPSNTTIVGVPGTKAGITGGSLQVSNVKNVIIRNLTFADTQDCFPQWDPTDGSSGKWNSNYDSVTLRGATNVWADHNTFTDAPTFDKTEKTYFGRKYQVHDGALDITNGSDLVTVERNQFLNHDKTMLIGSSDTDSTGKLRVTIHHNVWKGIVQRAPLARIGQIHLYNNVYETTTVNGYAPKYSIDSRAKAQVVAERNVWKLPAGAKVAKLLSGDGTGSIAGKGNLVNGTETDLVAAYNSANSKKIKTTVNWTPTLTAGLQTSVKNLLTDLTNLTGTSAAGAGLLS
ncbi:polysaccharide lyase family 1 protein [Streptomyces ipomoeae]|uniref:Tat pathway signal sequence domain protein n=1 Tax=Streptomyces ipomoeae 91-03 TaxID=698759 RepID=L1KLL0_9ACTN|nr:polysaccharide lyase family 1 protein [Streptomyces ipomoeae]EKX61355.1 Tat pathway signal sequence domain protein [Streptomyces ipomoeae 91-03]MDX2700309.1 polysaccharide lyase family 1 protein [Streptomyces ipomoeae]MDX2827670.1 polysaccharide lyase family 1 protein [Streptomyces ipomoeae]MDX2845369.1 polysaccharide lyase family 1 protein [Streptomyces ipomoeae]MDX2874666.1 polysaccharide lyase family 1 protein [Streptomyces ipomoeae]